MALELSVILEQAGYQAGRDYQIRKVYRVDALGEVLEWKHVDPYPTQQQLNTWEAQAESAIAAKQAIETERATLKTTAEIAKQHASKIRLCYAAIVAADLAAEDAGTRFARYRAALQDGSIPNQFRSLVLATFTSETGIVLSLATDPSSVVAATKQAFNLFYRNFFNSWALMLLASI